tara:strand:- start:14721 stop:15206 length:486 start_codon:yes stop_codon:yes gene_type:complete
MSIREQLKKDKKKGKKLLHHGRFIPKFPEKYLGDTSKITYRSSWERKCMNNFDLDPKILAWNSEELVIPYLSPKDGRIHRYFVDFVIVTKDKEGKKQVTAIEVKPEKEKFPPKKQGKKKSRFLQECMTFEINQAKWKHAESYCNKKGWNFIIMTEKHIFGK